MIQSRYRISVALALMVAGVVVAIIGYFGVANETEVPFQLPYFASAGIGALLLFGAGATMLLSAQLDTDRERLEQLEDAVRTLGEEVGRLSNEMTEGRGRRAKRPA